MQTITIPKTTYEQLKQKAALYDRVSRTAADAKPSRYLRQQAKTDEEIWEEIEPTMHRIREELFKKEYPKLYAATKKARKSVS